MFFIYFIFSFFLFPSFNQRGDIYMCSEEKFLDEQCLDERILGDNRFFFLRKCRLNQACQILTKSPINNSIGICVTRKHHLYDGDNCRKNYECSSGICKDNQCEGLSLNIKCDPNRYQCKLGLICNSQLSSNDNKLFTCQKPIEEGNECKETNDCNLGYICSISSKNSVKTCIQMGSLEVGQQNSDPKACKTGDSYNNICIRRINTTVCDKNNKCNVTIESNNMLDSIIEDECKFSSKGASICPNNLIEQSFENYTSDFFKNNDVDDNFNIERYKYTLNVKSVIEKYFLYQYWYLVIDTDECAYEYFFLLNNQKRVIFNFKILFFFILIIF